MAEKQRTSDSLAYVTAREKGQTDAWTEEAKQRGGQRLTEVAEVVPPAMVAEALGLQEGGTAVVRRRSILLDDAVIELADSYYPAELATGTGLAEARKIKGGAPTLLAELGYRPRHVSEDVEIREATESERATLGLPKGADVLHVLRTTMAADRSPYEAQLMVMKPPRRLHYEFEVD